MSTREAALIISLVLDSQAMPTEAELPFWEISIYPRKERLTALYREYKRHSSFSESAKLARSIVTKEMIDDLILAELMEEPK